MKQKAGTDRIIILPKNIINIVIINLIPVDDTADISVERLNINNMIDPRVIQYRPPFLIIQKTQVLKPLFFFTMWVYIN